MNEIVKKAYREFINELNNLGFEGAFGYYEHYDYPYLISLTHTFEEPYLLLLEISHVGSHRASKEIDPSYFLMHECKADVVYDCIRSLEYKIGTLILAPGKKWKQKSPTITSAEE
jgi:hypothetical protein